MGRQIGQSCKICRRRGEKLFLKGERCYSAKCSISRRPYPPGIHGATIKKGRKKSDYAVRLNEKQKARCSYGIGEKQFRTIFMKAATQKGMTGENFIKLLERRIDNFIFRIGVASSRAHARQLIRHGHIMVNGRKVDIPSYTLNIDDVVKIKEKSKSLFKQSLELASKKKSDWFIVDAQNGQGTLLRIPDRQEIDAPVEEQLIVEFYSR